MKNPQFMQIALPAGILVVMFVGLCFINQNPDSLPSRPLISIMKDKMAASKAAEDAKPETLYYGQPDKEVQQLLGPPAGTMTITNRVTWMYYGSMLDFIDGKLITSNETVFGKIMQEHQRKLDRQADKGSLLDGVKSKF